MTELQVTAGDGGTVVVTASFYDESEPPELVVPNSVAWSLRSGSGSIVNAREDVSVTPASSITIVLTGDDLLYSDGKKRWLTIQATYDSTNGSGLSLTGEATFEIEDYLGI